MKAIRILLAVLTISVSIAVLIVWSGQRTKAQSSIQGMIPDQATQKVILDSMNAARDHAETLIKRDTGIVVDILPLKWSPTLAQTAEARLRLQLSMSDGADHLDDKVAEIVQPYGYGPTYMSKASFAAADLVKGFSGNKDKCTTAEWTANAYGECGEKAANSFVVVSTGTYKRACNVGVPDNRKMVSCGHYGNIIEKSYKTVGCARVEKVINKESNNNRELTNGGWSCVFSDKEVQ